MANGRSPSCITCRNLAVPDESSRERLENIFVKQADCSCVKQRVHLPFLGSIPLLFICTEYQDEKDGKGITDHWHEKWLVEIKSDRLYWYRSDYEPKLSNACAFHTLKPLE